MNIRRWEFTDLAAIAELEKACFADAWTYRQLADGFLSAGFVGYLAEDGGEIVGCAACQKRRICCASPFPAAAAGRGLQARSSKRSLPRRC